MKMSTVACLADLFDDNSDCRRRYIVNVIFSTKVMKQMCGLVLLQADVHRIHGFHSFQGGA